MEVADFLAGLPFLVPVTKKELVRLQKKAYQFHSILEEAMVCFQVERHLLWFVPPASKTKDEKFMADFDHTQMELQVVLLLPTDATKKAEATGADGSQKEEESKKRKRGEHEEQDGEVVPGVLLKIGGAFYLFDHTSIESVCIPRRVESTMGKGKGKGKGKDKQAEDNSENKDNQEPYSLFYTLKDVSMRWYMRQQKSTASTNPNTPGSGPREEDLQALLEAIRLMNSYLKPNVLGASSDSLDTLLPATKRAAISSTGMANSQGNEGDREWHHCASRLTAASLGMIAATHGTAEAVSPPLHPSQVTWALFNAGAGSSNNGAMPLNDSGNRRQEHLSLMAAKYQQLPHFLRPLREAPSRQTLPVSGEGENPPCILSLAEANDLEARYLALVDKCRTDIENALNGHYGASGGSQPSSQSQSQSVSLSQGSTGGTAGGAGGEFMKRTHHDTNISQETKDKDGEDVDVNKTQDQQYRQQQQVEQEQASCAKRLASDLRRFALLTQETALLRSMPRAGLFYEIEKEDRSVARTGGTVTGDVV